MPMMQGWPLSIIQVLNLIISAILFAGKRVQSVLIFLVLSLKAIKS